MSQRIHLAWASVSLAMVGVGFGLGSLEAGSPESPRAPAQAAESARSPSPESPPQAAPTTQTPAPVSAVSSAAPQVERSEPSAPTQPAALAQGGAAAPTVPARHTTPAPLPVQPGPAPVLLDPDAEALVRILLRLRLESHTEDPETPEERSARQRDFVQDTIQNMFWRLEEEQKIPIYVALAALLPSEQHWQNYGSTVPPDLLNVRRAAYERERTPKSLEVLVELLERADPEGLDHRWVEELARENPNHADLQSLLATIAPERAAKVFAEGGLTRGERELLIDVVGREDSAAAAQLALELLVESFDVDHLVSALEYDPRGTASFLQQRRGDPRWEELAAMAHLQRAYGEAETQAQNMEAVAKYWRQLSPKRLPEVLYMLEDGSWTPLEGEILEVILAQGDPELASNLEHLLPPELQWKLRARQDRLEGEEWEVEAEVQYFLEFLDEAPFKARASLEDLYQAVPQPSSLGAFRLASSFQEKGDSESAVAILQRAQAGKLTSAARAQLEAGLSLSDIDEEEFESDDDDE